MEARRFATYRDLLDVPAPLVAELLYGMLYTSPRPAPRHAMTASVMGGVLNPVWQRGKGGPGGWWILDEPELHFAGGHVVVPDIGGWKKERMPYLPHQEAHFSVVPDWVCEVLSPSTARLDRGPKQRAYAEAGVEWMWLVDPIAKFVEVFELVDGNYLRRQFVTDDPEATLHPFAAIPMDVRELWMEEPPE